MKRRRAVVSRLSASRVALNLEQVVAHNLLPNPVKHADVRARAYVEYMENSGFVGQHAQRCWEVDALEPTEFDRILQAEIDLRRDSERWMASLAREEAERAQVSAVASRWDDVSGLLG